MAHQLSGIQHPFPRRKDLYTQLQSQVTIQKLRLQPDDVRLLDQMSIKMGGFQLDALEMQTKLRECRDIVRAQINDQSFGVRAEILLILENCVADPRIRADLRSLLVLTV